jgi:uncharacterized protein YndB with AHSA1/START domain
MTADVAERTINIEIKPREVIISRVVHAPRDLVYRAFTDPTMLSKWFGPHGFESHATSDPRKGGRFSMTMIGPDGVKYPMTGVYEDVVPNERIRYTADLSGHSDEWKAAIRENLTGPATEEEMVNSVADITFEDAGDNATLVTVRSYFKQDAVRDSYVKTGMNVGWSQSFERLDSLVSDLPARKTTIFERLSDTEVFLSREFDAPRDLLYRVYTDAKLIPEWWGPRKESVVVDKCDLRPGGEWRFVSTSPNGVVHGFHGTYTKVDPPNELGMTFEYEGAPGHVVTVRALFEELTPKKSRVRSWNTFSSKEACDGMVNSGMQSGATESNDRLDEVLSRFRQDSHSRLSK